MPLGHQPIRPSLCRARYPTLQSTEMTSRGSLMGFSSCHVGSQHKRCYVKNCLPNWPPNSPHKKIVISVISITYIHGILQLKKMVDGALIFSKCCLPLFVENRPKPGACRLLTLPPDQEAEPIGATHKHQILEEETSLVSFLWGSREGQKIVKTSQHGIWSIAATCSIYYISIYTSWIFMESIFGIILAWNLLPHCSWRVPKVCYGSCRRPGETTGCIWHKSNVIRSDSCDLAFNTLRSARKSKGP